MQSIDWLKSQKLAAAAWARTMLESRFLVLDTETSGVRGGYHEIVQIAIIDSTGTPLLDSLIKPVHPERLLEWGTGSKRAIDIHGITPQMLENAPTFPAVYETISQIVAGQQVVIFNSAFDEKMIEGDARRHQLAVPSVGKYHCAMLYYAQWYGALGGYGGGFRWQSLEKACQQLHIQTPEKAHSALGDCLRTLEVVKRMADV